MGAAPESEEQAMNAVWSTPAGVSMENRRSSCCSDKDVPHRSRKHTTGVPASLQTETTFAGLPGAANRRRRLERFSIFDVKAMESLFARNEVKIMHLYTLWRHIVQKSVLDLGSIPGLPKIVPLLVERYCLFPSCAVVKRSESADGSTSKLLIELQDGKRIESVIMRYGQVELETFPTNNTISRQEAKGQEDFDKTSSATTFTSGPRSTVCVSSQIGCAMGCTFCATGTMKLQGNLTSGEIVEQLYLASRLEPIRNVVFMGMGEPLDNYDEVVDAIRLMTDVRVFRLCSSRVSLSTVGVLPRLRQLKLDVPDISLAVSLHAPTQAIREKIVPSAKSWRIDDILAAAFDYAVSQKCRTSRNMKRPGLVLLEYVLISGVNSSVECGETLGHLLQSQAELVHLNVIPYNPIPGSLLKTPSQQEIDAFVAVLRLQDIRVTIRQTLGQDVAGACGQLVVQSQSNSATACSISASTDMEDMLPTAPALVPTLELSSGHLNVVLSSPERKESSSSGGATAVSTMKPSGFQWWLAALAGTTLLALTWTSWTSVVRRLAAGKLQR